MQKINLAIGEPTLIRQNLLQILPQQILTHNQLDYTYPPLGGLEELRKFLEDKHQANVVICAGAQQGLQASLYAWKKMGHINVYVPRPYWNYLPKIVKLMGMTFYDQIPNSGGHISLFTRPNNPDNSEPAMPIINPCIHDAAYYTPIYTDSCEDTFGDMQVFSYSKKFGLSGHRVGYVAVHNERYYPYVREFVEQNTSGTSLLSQQIILDIEKVFAADKQLERTFYQKCRMDLDKNRQLLHTLPQSVADTQTMTKLGMFGWVKGETEPFDKVHVSVSPGEAFGTPGMVRINLAADHSTFQEAVNRLKTS